MAPGSQGQSDGLRVEISALTARLGKTLDASVIVVVWPNDREAPALSALSNTANLALMILNLCELATSTPRPDDCANCAKAWDGMRAAKLALTPIERGCA